MSFQVCAAVTTLCKLSSILSWHSTLMAQDQLTVMQDLAGHEPSVKLRASAILQAPHEQCSLCCVAASLQLENL